MTPQEIFAKSLVTYDKTSRSNDSFYYHLPYPPQISMPAQFVHTSSLHPFFTLRHFLIQTAKSIYFSIIYIRFFNNPHYDYYVTNTSQTNIYNPLCCLKVPI